jgi:hypothetical protein
LCVADDHRLANVPNFFFGDGFEHNFGANSSRIPHRDPNARAGAAGTHMRTILRHIIHPIEEGDTKATVLNSSLPLRKTLEGA